MRGLVWATPPAWVRAVEREPLALLSDHAHCEMKASATAQSLLLRCADEAPVVEELAAMAGEELEHFRRVVDLLHRRGGRLQRAEKSPYAEGLRARAGGAGGPRLLDRLLIAQLIEARSCERFRLLGEHLRDPELAALYSGLAASEAGHRALFGRLARRFFPAEEVRARAAELARAEGELVASLACVARVHSGPPRGADA